MEFDINIKENDPVEVAWKDFTFCEIKHSVHYYRGMDNSNFHYALSKESPIVIGI